jgi:hypothetical protein
MGVAGARRAGHGDVVVNGKLVVAIFFSRGVGDGRLVGPFSNGSGLYRMTHVQNIILSSVA